MKPEAQEVIRIAQQITDIDEEIESLQEQKMRLEHRLDDLVISRAAAVNVLPKPSDALRRGRSPSETSAKKVIANYLSKYPEGNFTAEVVAEGTQMNLGTVRTNLSRLVREGVIEKRSFNTYGARRQEKEASEEAPMSAELSF